MAKNKKFTTEYTELHRGRKRPRTKNSVSLCDLCGFFFLLIFSSFVNLFAQEAELEVLAPEITEEEINLLSSAEITQINMELKTSSLSELAIWCRTLGLSESGTREDLILRIREHFKISETSEPAAKKIIKIESAQSSEYFTIDVIGEDYARLKGDVKLSLQDGDKTHRINADEILFNRTRNIINASGNVFYEKVDGASVETFRGQNITVNIDDWSSIFLDGSSEKKLSSDGSSYRFSGKVISRSDEEATILSNASISNAESEEAYWSISASRLWLLQGADFAILNAVLKVGEIPVLYLPFLYYPADEMVFHPVLGYRSREGAFVQTTTYILGQPKADPEKQNSISKIISNSDDGDLELQGLFLHSTGKKTVDPTKVSLKAMVDYYVNLGTHIGIDFSAPKTGILNQLDLSLGIGLTRTVSLSGGNYTPYTSKDENDFFDGTYDWNKSNLFSATVPFRYRMTFGSSISGALGSLSWSFPFYSDPTVDSDLYKNRSETMDWMNMIQQGAAMDDSSSESTIGDYRWNVSGIINPSFPSLAPYISRVSISNISTSVSFKQITDSLISSNNPYSPGRLFFAPDKYTIYNFSGSVAGTPLSYGKKQEKKDTAGKKEAKDPFNGYGVPISPFADEKNKSSNFETSAAKPADIISPPALGNTFNIPGEGNNIFSVDYSLSPTSSSELQFMHTRLHQEDKNWLSAEDVDWSEYQSILFNISGNSILNLRLDHSSGLYSNTLSFNGRATWQDYSYLNEEYYRKLDNTIDENKMNEDKRRQYSWTNYNTTYTYNTTVRPLYNNEVFGQSNVQYTFGGTLVKSKKYNNGDGPELEPEWGSWVREDRSKDIYGLTSHKLSTNFDANIMDKRQNLSLSADLPPLYGLVAGNATFRVWITETAISTRMEEKVEDNEWVFKPIYFTETLRFGKSNSFVYYMVITPEENNDITTIKSTLTLWNFSAIFSASQGKRSSFVFNNPSDHRQGGSWVAAGEPTLLPKELSFAYRQSSQNIEIIKNRVNLTFNVDSMLQFDLQQYTNSNFRFSVGFITNITGFLELRLSMSSINSVIWRYFKNFPGLEEQTSMYPDGPQNNLFTDLFDSFNFFDESKRRRSGFKLNRFNLKATHHLGDWAAELDIGMQPYQDLKSKKYELISDISFIVKWTPIPEIKTDYAFDGKEKKWKKR